MADKDLRPGTKDFRVTTKVERGGQWYMGDDVIVTARDESHAAEVAKQNGYVPNEHFPPQQIKK